MDITIKKDANEIKTILKSYLASENEETLLLAYIKKFAPTFGFMLLICVGLYLYHETSTVHYLANSLLLFFIIVTIFKYYKHRKKLASTNIKVEQFSKWAYGHIKIDANRLDYKLNNHYAISDIKNLMIATENELYDILKDKKSKKEILIPKFLITADEYNAIVQLINKSQLQHIPIH